MALKSLLGLASPGGRRGRLSILIFHRILPVPDPLCPGEPDVESFHARMRWVADWFNVLPLDEAVSRLRAGSLPSRAAAITFDDGHVDGYTHALPVLQRYGLSATFFVTSGFTSGGWMWDDSIVEAIRAARGDFLDTGVASLPPLPVRDIAEKRLSLDRLMRTVKYMPPAARQDAVARILAASGAVLGDNPMLKPEHIRALRAAGMLIGAHTRSHPLFAVCSDAEVEAEIAGGKEELEALLREPVRLFAYPNGMPWADFTRRHVDMVCRLGFDAAVTTSWGVNTRDTDPFELRRFTPWDRSRWRFGLRMFSSFFCPESRTLR